MEISVSKKTNGHYKENPAVGEIVIEVKQSTIGVEKINPDDEFLSLLEEYVDKAENFGDFDIDVEDKLFSLGINKNQFINMKNELMRQGTNEYATDMHDKEEYPSFTGFINFPYKDWIERLITIG